MTPIYDTLIADHPAALAALTRKPWSYADALAAADEAIAKRKRPAKKAAKRVAKKAAS